MKREIKIKSVLLYKTLSFDNVGGNYVFAVINWMLCLEFYMDWIILDYILMVWEPHH